MHYFYKKLHYHLVHTFITKEDFINFKEEINLKFNEIQNNINTLTLDLKLLHSKLNNLEIKFDKLENNLNSKIDKTETNLSNKIELQIDRNFYKSIIAITGLLISTFTLFGIIQYQINN